MLALLTSSRPAITCPEIALSPGLKAARETRLSRTEHPFGRTPRRSRDGRQAVQIGGYLKSVWKKTWS
jgi:hypothetical protein